MTSVLISYNVNTVNNFGGHEHSGYENALKTVLFFTLRIQYGGRIINYA